MESIKILVFIVVILLNFCHSKNFWTYSRSSSGNLVTENRNSNITNCECVLYYQCTEDFKIITNGEGLMTVSFRNGMAQRKTCGDIYHVCCDPPMVTSMRMSMAPTNSRQCGRSISDKSPALMFPWSLQLLHKDSFSNHRFRCSAALIHPQAAITSAQCFQSDKNPAMYKTRSACATLREPNTPPHQADRFVSAIIIHPAFNYHPLANDIAIIILEDPYTSVSNVTQACLPPRVHNLIKSSCHLTGFGNIGSEMPVGFLQTSKVAILPRDYCMPFGPLATPGSRDHVHNSFLCGEGCAMEAGDIGSPLSCSIKDDNSEDNHMVIAGLLSWGPGCQPDAPARVVAYTDVGKFTNWIMHEMRVAFKRAMRMGD